MTTTMIIDDVIGGLGRVFSEGFTDEEVLQYLQTNPIDIAALEPFIRFSERTYTRNLIHKDDAFEAVLLCWEPGQHSLVHRHVDQQGWVVVVKGELVITTFTKLRSEIIESEEPDISWSRFGSIYLRENHSYTVREGNVFREVNKPETIHKTENPVSLSQQAISVHICSRPSDTSVIYDVENHRCRTVRMGYM